MKYRKKPVVIDAHRHTTINALFVWMQTFPGTNEFKVEAGAVIIPTLEGDMVVTPGDWVIRGIKGEFYPCKPDIFDATYEPA